MQWKLVVSEEKDWERWKISLWIGGIGIAKNDLFTKQNLQVQYNSNKNTENFFTETWKYSEINIGSWKTKDIQRNTEQNNKFGRIIITYFKP